MKAKKQTPVSPDAFADLLPVEALYIAPGEYEMVADPRNKTPKTLSVDPI